MADVGLRSKSAVSQASFVKCQFAYIYLPIFEPLLKIFIYGFIRDFTDQGEVRYADFLLLGALEYGFPNLRLSSSAADRLSIVGVLFSTGALGDCL